MSKYFETIHKKAIKGDAEAQVRLAALYYYGDEVNKDDSKAFEWFRRAAEKGYALAQYELGKCYRRGIGVEQDNNLAFNCFKKASELGNADAENAIGYYYENGISVKRDYEKAKLWYLQAAFHGSVAAIITLEIHYGITPSGGVQMPIDYKNWRMLFNQSIEKVPKEILHQEKDRKGTTINNSNITISLPSLNEVIL